MLWCYVVFFFSSRRRHTRYIGDWSSDVCSSDLAISSRPFGCSRDSNPSPPSPSRSRARPVLRVPLPPLLLPPPSPASWAPAEPSEIGRASCRERVEVAVGRLEFEEGSTDGAESW